MERIAYARFVCAQPFTSQIIYSFWLFEAARLTGMDLILNDGNHRVEIYTLYHKVDLPVEVKMGTSYPCTQSNIDDFQHDDWKVFSILFANLRITSWKPWCDFETQDGIGTRARMSLSRRPMTRILRFSIPGVEAKSTSVGATRGL